MNTATSLTSSALDWGGSSASKKACWAHQFQYLGVGQQYPPVIYTHDDRGNAADLTCTETQSIHQRRVGGRPGSFWTACGEQGLATAMGKMDLLTCLHEHVSRSEEMR